MIAAWTVFIVLVGVWQLVGAWRSATRRISALRQEKRWAIWAHLARGMVTLGAASLAVQVVRNIGPGTFANLQIVFGAEPLAPHALRIADDGATIVLSGGIGPGVAAEFRALLDASPAVRRAELTSNGGRVAEALLVEALIRARGLETYASGFCASACTIIYMGGQERLLGPAGRLGFHRYAFPGLTSEQEALVNDKGKATLIDAGVSPAFIARAFETPAETVWITDQATLLAARVATRLGTE
jgi:hypothetical protein